MPFDDVLDATGRPREVKRRRGHRNIDAILRAFTGVYSPS